MIITALIIVLVTIVLGFLFNMLVPLLITASLDITTTLWTLGLNFIATILTYTLGGTATTGTQAGFAIALNTANGVITVVAMALLVCFSLAEIIRTSANFMDTKRFETVFKSFFKIACIGWVLSNWYDLAKTIYNDIFVALANEIYGGASWTFPNLYSIFIGSSSSWEACMEDTGFRAILDQIGNQFTDVDTALEAVGNILPIWAVVAFVLSIILAVSAISSLVAGITSVGSRLLRAWLHIAIGPLALSTLPCKETSFVARKYITSFIGVALESVLGVVLILIFPGFVSFFLSGSLWMNSGIVGTLFDGSTFVDMCGGFVWFSIGCTTCFGIFKQLMGSLDHLTQQMTGLGGA